MGRAIIREPEVFLMDEPLSNLDAKHVMRDASKRRRVPIARAITTARRPQVDHSTARTGNASDYPAKKSLQIERADARIRTAGPLHYERCAAVAAGRARSREAAWENESRAASMAAED
jgi:hypothetical protein